MMTSLKSLNRNKNYKRYKKCHIHVNIALAAKLSTIALRLFTYQNTYKHTYKN